MPLLGLLFALAALGALLGLAAVAAHDVPPIAGTVALILTLAALGVAILN
ncbi:hypothetical protein NLX86_06610 [Streptomyces sp. A3M-1-3]|nr:hypothetical protein [Streptomyces sp. A3M-1-3]MCP3817818.1 hypothetical protein [Streptomyces sp. A3M-1-3]